MGRVARRPRVVVHTGPVPPIGSPPLVALASLALLAAACSSSDGRELPPPRPGQTTTASTSAPALDSTPGGGVVEVFTLLSPAFDAGGPIDVAHTCAGADRSPPLSWASVPPAAELAIVARDANGVIHWLVTGIDPLVQGIAEGGVPEGAIEHVNGFGEARWQGPCPAEGQSATYELALYALPEPLPVAQRSVPSAELVTQIERTASDAAVLTFTFAR